MIVERIRLQKFLVASLFAHFLFLLAFTILTPTSRILPETPLRVRIISPETPPPGGTLVDQPRPPAGKAAPPATKDFGEWSSRARRPAAIEGPARTPGSLGIPRIGSAPSPPAQPGPPASQASPPAADAAPAGTQSARGGPPGPDGTAKARSTPPPAGQGLATRSAPPAAGPGATAGTRSAPGADAKPARPSWREQIASISPGFAGTREEPFDTGEEGDSGSTTDRTVSLDSQDFRYASYLAGIKRKIEGLWGYPLEAQARGITGSLLVVFTIAQDGSLNDLQLVQGSGYTILDDEALNAVRRAAPYNPFPERMRFERLHITASFQYVSGTFYRLRGYRVP